MAEFSTPTKKADLRPIAQHLLVEDLSRYQNVIDDRSTKAFDQAIEFFELLEKLRFDEGSSVEFTSDNAGFNGLPNCAVDVTDAWTDWKPETFRADTVIECLRAACAAKQANLKPTSHA